MKVTVALLALTVLFALAASQRRRRHSYDIEEGIPSWNFGPITLTPEPNKRDDSDAGLKMPGLFDLGGHTSWKVDSDGPTRCGGPRIKGFGSKFEVMGRSGRRTASSIPWI